MNIKFESYSYSPLVRSRRAELKGYSHLSPEIKSMILPCFVLGKWPRSVDIRDAMAKCIEVVGEGNPFVVDTTRLAEHRGQVDDGHTVHDLVNPTGAFENWRNFVDEYAVEHNIVPTVQLHNDATPRDIFQQILMLESKHRNIAFRLNAAKNKQLEITANGLGVMAAPENAVVYVDLGYITEGNLPSSERAAVTCINTLRSIESKVNIVLCASSFPGNVASYGERSGVIPILERRLFRRLGGPEVAIYGDYSSIHPEVTQAAYGYVPRVDYPTPEDWYYFRKQADPKVDGYIASANSVTNLDEWNPDLDCWGVSEILRVSNGDADKMGSPANWIAVRVNIHLTIQASNPPDGYQDILSEDDLDDDDDWAL